MLLTVGCLAQKRTFQATMFNEFKPSVVTFKDGHQSRQPLTNVFLKNSALLFLQNDYTMEANMDNIVAVDFINDRSFVVINKQLAYFVDSVGSNKLYCIELFDIDSYERNLKNNVNIQNIEFGEQMSTTAVDLNVEDDFKLPVFRHYYFLYNGNYVHVHERDLGKVLSKENKTMMKRIIALPDFSWQDEKSLKKLLEAITE